MSGFDKAAAERAIEALQLERSNGELAMRWLALWQGNALPPRESFRPANFKAFLPTVGLFNVVPDVGVTVRLSGTRFAHILGQDMTGEDWIAAAPQSHRAARLKIYSEIARGAILIDHRRLATTEGKDYVSEVMVLPFAPDAHGVSPVLMHANLPADRYLKLKSMSQAMAEPENFRLVPLKRADEAAGQAAAGSAIIAA